MSSTVVQRAANITCILATISSSLSKFLIKMLGKIIFKNVNKRVIIFKTFTAFTIYDILLPIYE